MGDWKDDIRAQLIDVRGQPTRPNLHRLSTSHAIDARSFHALRTHQQHWAQAYCAGLSVRAAVITGRASAYLNGMWTANTPLDTTHLILPSVPPRRQWPAGITYVRAALEESAITRGAAMSTTTAFRTFTDIARFDGLAHALVAADWLVKYGGYTPAELRSAVEGLPRVPGKPVAREAARHALRETDSAPESFARGLLIAAGFTRVEANVQIPGLGYRVDLLIDGWLIIEIDGLVKYDGTTYGPADKALLAEKRRADRLNNAGYPILRFPPSFLERQPEKFIAQVRARHERGW